MATGWSASLASCKASHAAASTSASSRDGRVQPHSSSRSRGGLQARNGPAAWTPLVPCMSLGPAVRLPLESDAFHGLHHTSRRVLAAATADPAAAEQGPDQGSLSTAAQKQPSSKQQRRQAQAQGGRAGSPGSPVPPTPASEPATEQARELSDEERARILTARIMRADTPQRLRTLVLGRQQQSNKRLGQEWSAAPAAADAGGSAGSPAPASHVHLSAAAVRCMQLALAGSGSPGSAAGSSGDFDGAETAQRKWAPISQQQQQQQATALLPELLSAVQPGLLSSCPARPAATILWAAARAGAALDTQPVSVLLGRVASGSLAPAAPGQSGKKSGGGSGAGKNALEVLEPASLSNAVWAAGRLAPSALQAALPRLAPMIARCLPDLTPAQVSALVWGLACTGGSPGAQLSEALAEELWTRGPGGFPPQDFFTLLSAWMKWQQAGADAGAGAGGLEDGPAAPQGQGHQSQQARSAQQQLQEEEAPLVPVGLQRAFATQLYKPALMHTARAGGSAGGGRGALWLLVAANQGSPQLRLSRKAALALLSLATAGAPSAGPSEVSAGLWAAATALERTQEQQRRARRRAREQPDADPELPYAWKQLASALCARAEALLPQAVPTSTASGGTAADGGAVGDAVLALEPGEPSTKSSGTTSSGGGGGGSRGSGESIPGPALARALLALRRLQVLGALKPQPRLLGRYAAALSSALDTSSSGTGRSQSSSKRRQVEALGLQHADLVMLLAAAPGLGLPLTRSQVRKLAVLALDLPVPSRPAPSRHSSSSNASSTGGSLSSAGGAASSSTQTGSTPTHEAHGPEAGADEAPGQWQLHELSALLACCARYEVKLPASLADRVRAAGCAAMGLSLTGSVAGQTQLSTAPPQEPSTQPVTQRHFRQASPRPARAGSPRPSSAGAELLAALVSGSPSVASASMDAEPDAESGGLHRPRLFGGLSSGEAGPGGDKGAAQAGDSQEVSGARQSGSNPDAGGAGAGRGSASAAEAALGSVKQLRCSPLTALTLMSAGARAGVAWPEPALLALSGTALLGAVRKQQPGGRPGQPAKGTGPGRPGQGSAVGPGRHAGAVVVPERLVRLLRALAAQQQLAHALAPSASPSQPAAAAAPMWLPLLSPFLQSVTALQEMGPGHAGMALQALAAALNPGAADAGPEAASSDGPSAGARKVGLRLSMSPGSVALQRPAVRDSPSSTGARPPAVPLPQLPNRLQRSAPTATHRLLELCSSVPEAAGLLQAMLALGLLPGPQWLDVYGITLERVLSGHDISSALGDASSRNDASRHTAGAGSSRAEVRHAARLLLQVWQLARRNPTTIGRQLGQEGGGDGSVKRVSVHQGRRRTGGACRGAAWRLAQAVSGPDLAAGPGTGSSITAPSRPENEAVVAEAEAAAVMELAGAGASDESAAGGAVEKASGERQSAASLLGRVRDPELRLLLSKVLGVAAFRKKIS